MRTSELENHSDTSLTGRVSVEVNAVALSLVSGQLAMTDRTYCLVAWLAGSMGDRPLTKSEFPL